MGIHRGVIAAMCLSLMGLQTAWAGQFDPPVGLRDEGGTETKPVFTIDCVGAGITCSHSGITGTLTVAGGGTPTWDAILSPVGNQALDMGAFTTDWTNVANWTMNVFSAINLQLTTGDALRIQDVPILLDSPISGDTDYWVDPINDGDGTDDDVLQVGTGTTVGSNIIFTYDAGVFVFGGNSTAPVDLFTLKTNTLGDGMRFTFTDNFGFSPGPRLLMSHIYGGFGSPDVNDEVGEVVFAGGNTSGAGSEISYGGIVATIQTATDGAEDGQLSFYNVVDGSLDEVLRINSSNQLDILGTNPTLKWTDSSAGAKGFEINANGQGLFIANTTDNVQLMILGPNNAVYLPNLPNCNQLGTGPDGKVYCAG